VDSDDGDVEVVPEIPNPKRFRSAMCAAARCSSSCVLESVPCDRCGLQVPFAAFAEHAAAHLQEGAPGSSCSSGAALDLTDLIPCEWCGDLFLPTEYAAHVAEHEASRRSAEKEDLASFTTPDMLAARLVEDLRSAADAKGTNGELVLPHGSVANFDLAVSFILRARLMLDAIGRDLADPKIVYHWTPRANFRAIMDGNLRVPDGQSVLHRTDSGFYGRGIYTSPEFTYGSAYAYGDGACFICMALPGRQFSSTYPYDQGGPCRTGYDSHTSADRNNMEWVFFASDQLLPCFVVDATTHAVALKAVHAAMHVLAQKLSATRADGGDKLSSFSS